MAEGRLQRFQPRDAIRIGLDVHPSSDSGEAPNIGLSASISWMAIQVITNIGVWGRSRSQSDVVTLTGIDATFSETEFDPDEVDALALLAAQGGPALMQEKPAKCAAMIDVLCDDVALFGRDSATIRCASLAHIPRPHRGMGTEDPGKTVFDGSHVAPARH